MRKTAPVVIRMLFCGEIISTFGIHVCVYSTFKTRHANGRVTTQSTPPPANITGPFCEFSVDHALLTG